MLIDHALHALAVVFDPARFAIIVAGIVLGLIIGILPGIGGLAGLALLIPFTHAMDAPTALAFLIGMWAVTATADTVPAILFGVPGAVGSAATVLDGHPMAKRGEAGRAFGASFSASIAGGLFGAVLLAVSIPLLRPFMLAIGTPELLAVCVLGLTLVASLSQGAVLKGLLVAVFGVLLAAVGDEAQSGQLRWTFDDLLEGYLQDGMPIESIALGLFALPELLDMAIARTNVAQTQRLGGLFREQWRGVADVCRNWKLVVNSSSIGVVLGSVPGMGAAVIDWIAYGTAARLVKGAAESFGKGDVRGLIAAEAANNAREGGALIPTLAFGVPGSPSMALLLGAFLSHGITPGPRLLDADLDITYTLIWSLALANVVGAGICFLAANPLARIAMVPAGILVPAVFAVCFVGAYQGSFGDLVVLVAFGLVGWLMKQHGFARAPLILGFILGKLIEKYLFISVGRYQFDWLTRPGVVVIFTVTGLVLLRPLVAQVVRMRRAAPEAGPAPAAVSEPAPGGMEITRLIGRGIWLAAFAALVAAVLSAQGWRLSARLMPLTAAAAGLAVIACAGIAAAAARFAGKAAPASRGAWELTGAFAGLAETTVLARLGVEALWLTGFLGAVVAVGLMPAMGVYLFLYMAIPGRTRWPTALAITAALWVSFHLLFVELLHVPWPPSLLGDLVPELRELTGRLL